MNNLTFEKLFDLIEVKLLRNETDRRIAEKIIEVGRDWGDWKTSANNLNEFIIILEKEVEGSVIKASLEKLMKKYNQNIIQNAWKAESISSLLEIFELTQETELRKIFDELTEKAKTN